MIIVLSILLIISLFLEGAVTTLPLVLICLLCLTILQKSAVVFPVAFLTGFILDIMAVRPWGETSLLFIVYLFLVLLYQRKYEIDSLPFVFVASFSGSLLFLTLFVHHAIIIQSLISAIFAVVVFIFIKKL